MSHLIAKANGNFTAGSSWGAAAAGANATQLSFVGTTSTTTSYVYSSAFTVTAGEIMDGILLALYRLGTTGTVSISLSDDNGVTATREVTINCADLPANANISSSTFVFFKFGSTLTGDGGADYKVGVKSSTAAQVGFNRDGTAGNWCRVIRTTPNATPVATDALYVCSEKTAAGAQTTRTITMNETATTSYGQVNIGEGGSLIYDVTQSTTLRCKNAVVYDGGTWTQGSLATPVPRAFTAVLEQDCSSDGQYGFSKRNGGTVNMVGESLSAGNDTYVCRLNTDEAVAQTVLGVDTSTGWPSGTNVAIAGTSRTVMQCEERVTTGAAGASSITVTAGLTFAHSGTAPLNAHIFALDRNVIFRSVSSTNMTYAAFYGTTGTTTIKWAMFQYSGWQSAAFAAVSLGDGNVNGATAPFSMTFSLTKLGEGAGFWAFTNSGNWTYEDNVQFRNGVVIGTGVRVDASTNTANPFTLRRAYIVGGHATANITVGFNIGDWNGTIANLYVINLPNLNSSLALGGGGTLQDLNWTIDGYECYGNVFNRAIAPSDGCPPGTLKNAICWYNGDGSSVYLSNVRVRALTIEDSKFIGNNEACIYLFGAPHLPRFTFRNCQFAGTTTYSQPSAVFMSPNGTNGHLIACDWRFENCTFGVATGIYVAHVTADLNFVNTWTYGQCYITWTFVGCTLGSTTEVANNFSANEVMEGSYLRFQNHDASTVMKTLTPIGSLTRETTTVDVSPSLKMTPLSATRKLDSAANQRGLGTFMVRVLSGATKTPTVKVQKDGSYNGNAPRLILKSNPAVGILVDTVLDTHSVAAGSFETLTGTTAAATADGVFEFVVDCDGTAGNVFVDTWAA